MGIGDELMAIRESLDFDRHDNEKLKMKFNKIPGFGFKRIGFCILSKDYKTIINSSDELFRSFFDSGIFIRLCSTHIFTIYLIWLSKHAVFNKNYPGKRPYISAVYKDRVKFKPLKTKKLLRIDLKEVLNRQNFSTNNEKFILMTAEVKGTFSSKNKQWPIEYFNELCELIQNSGMKVVEINSTGKQLIRSSEFYDTPTLSSVINLIVESKFVICNEGGLHHLAGFFNKPACVIFGGYISPEVTGYEFHYNFFKQHGDNLYGCGSINQCEYCIDSLSSITPQSIYNTIIKRKLI